jgi:valyl-tRNA synthetase
VMDTWATSSLTPQIAGGWCEDDDLFGRVFPMDLRPQAHDIIRTWLFTTLLRSHLEHDSEPWTDVAVSGWVLDPDRKKMSKSKGNVRTPMAELEKYGSDPIRYAAARVRLGLDAAFDEGQLKIGRRLAVKLLNASKFVLGFEPPPRDALPATPLDRSFLSHLAGVVDHATVALDGYEHARALDATERAFWDFTDDYLELVKNRAYGSQGQDAALSALTTLRLALSTFLRLFAPYQPFVTEEIWSWWRDDSIHRTAWPSAAELPSGDPRVFEAAAHALGRVRAAKTGVGISLGAPIEVVSIHAPPEVLGLLEPAGHDLAEAARASRCDLGPGEDLRVEVAPLEAQV